ncbi:PD40 domain-containing protein, partial [bacterium]|nr:PD40 domain-containing protein [bacterium]
KGHEFWLLSIGYSFTISPDGKNIIYGAENEEGVNQLYIRRIDQLEGMPINNTEGALHPFFSPNGKELGFYSSMDRKLKKVRIDGGPAQTLCDLDFTGSYMSTWGDDGTIITTNPDSGLLRISASGGIPEVILRPDSGKSYAYYRKPEMLPGNKAVLYMTWDGNTYDEGNINVLSLETGESKILIRGGTNPFYSPTGHILFGRSGTYWAVPFDAKRLEITGDLVPVCEEVTIWPGGYSQFDISTNGTLVYMPGVGEAPKQALVLVGRNGVETQISDKKHSYENPRFSPDGTEVAVSIRGEGFSNTNIWIHGIARDIETPLTASENDFNLMPSWTPDGQYVTFHSNQSGTYQIYLIRADGTGEAELLWPSENPQYGGSWSNDRTLFAFYEDHPTTGLDIWIYSTRDDTATVFLNTPNNESYPIFSPDGKWIAYRSNQTGKGEIYITPCPGPGPREQISTQGGGVPVWAPDGRELFYRESDKMMAVSIETEPSLKPGIPELLFEGEYIGTYDIHPNSNRFLMIKSVEDESESGFNQINIVLNWFEVLNEKMAGAGE